MSNESKQVKLGAIFSYLLIILNTVFGLFVSPFTLECLGDSSFGVYKTIASFSATLMVLDLGIGTTVMRYTAKYRAEKRPDKVGNFAAMGMIEAAVVSVVLCIVSFGVLFSFDGIFGKFTSAEMSLAKTLFLITVITMIGTVIDNVLSGVIMGSNRFVFINGFKVILLFARIILTYVFLYIAPNAVVLVLLTLGSTLLSALANYIYIVKKLKIRLKLISWDTGVFKESLGYTALMFLQTLAGQANGNVDNVVIGSVIGSVAVSVYSFGIQIFNMFETLATSFSNLMLPSISQKIADGASYSELQKSVTKIGRLQFALLIGALGGFLVVGREFIYLWLGDGFEDVYLLSLIMMVPVILTLIQNVCLSILRAKNMMVFRTIQLVLGFVFNAIFTFVGTKLYGYYAAAIGTGLSILLFSVIMMNFYYHKRIEFKVFKFYWDVTKGILPCAIITSAAVYFVDKVIGGSWLMLVIKICIFLLIYGLLLIFFGFNKSEKEMLLGKVINKIKRK
ncbi:MAG: oligosaccharide flippase family protein [Clostridia bacterium]|nr:oligosaccharide flippase family protein [Clostridia bacterium]